MTSQWKKSKKKNIVIRAFSAVGRQNPWKIAAYGAGIALAFLILVSLPQLNARIEAEGINSIPTLPKPNYFAAVSLNAKAAYVYDLTTKQELYGKNASEPLPLASLTKLMTTVTALNLAPTTTVVTITPASLATDGDSGLDSGEKWSLKNLLAYTLVVSSNDGAVAVAEALGSHAATNDSNPAALDRSQQDFISDMNQMANRLGLSNAEFSNPSGLDISSTQAGAYASAQDVEKLLVYAATNYPDILDLTRDPTVTESSLNDITHTGQNTDILTTQIPGLVAGKTGYTDLAGGNLAVIDDVTPHHPIAVIVLGSTYENRFTDVAQLVSAATKTVKTE